MRKYAKARNDIKELLETGKGYYEKIQRAVPFMKEAADKVFIYWKPETGEYAVRLKNPNASNREAIEKDAALSLHKAGCSVISEFDDNAGEDKGMVCVHHPKSYKPFVALNKYASWIDTPGKLALTGALLSGLGYGTYSWFMPNKGDGTDGPGGKQDPWTAAMRGLGYGALFGSIPGLLSGLSYGSLANGEAGGFFDWMKTKYSDMRSKSPSFNKSIEDAKATVTRMPLSQTALEKNSAFDSGASQWLNAMSPAKIMPLDLSRHKVVNVDAFNRITWDAAVDGTVSNNNALLTSGILDTTSAREKSNFVSPFGIAKTLVNAGIGYATGAVIGKTLGAMGMVSKDTQNKLREMGTWGGLLQGVGNTIR